MVGEGRRKAKQERS